MKSGERILKLDKDSLQRFSLKLRYLLRRLVSKTKDGQHKTPVCPELCVLRLANLSSKGGISAIALKEFELSTRDKEANPPHLSVWVEDCTTPEQAYRFLPNSNRKFVLRLRVNEICMLESHIQVWWIHLYIDINGRRERDYRPGACGHSGIVGLDRNSIPDKNLRKSLRSQLAEIASRDYWELKV